ncbi:hypothetical protein FD723_39880 (plasmid) [Nostoc sp. C052]|uniref:hypothetical protein n=1 Tax=Nostoc sp. C052 TaxID=2576902 RepID=UPI0015C3D702|nr:hypothetical protein [Nostoc sp. C052]QLE46373.1 hypothetical protein FD723_39880 [Nostoc sp. C052]
MKLQKEVRLSHGSSLQINYPEDWEGEKSGDEEDPQFFVSAQPKLLTGDEIQLAEQYLKTILTTQKLVLTGFVQIDPDDPLLEATHEELDRLETEKNFPVSRYASSGGNLPVLTRVLRIREQGYEGDKYLSINGGK